MKKFVIFFFIGFSFIYVKAQTEVTFYTTKGDFVVEIYDNIVPITGGNFLDLVDAKFYDGVIFHRVINNFMIQGGDPTGTGSGGPGYAIQDEFDPSLSNLQKTISMANSGPNTGGSQFFINLVDNTYLDYNKAPMTSAHPVFGKTVMNFNIVQAIGAVATDGSDRPITPVVMDSIRRGNIFTVGLDQPGSNLFKLSAYPNPVSDISVLTVSAERGGVAQVVVHDAQGKVVDNKRVSLMSGENKFAISSFLNDMVSQGMYNLTILFEGQASNIKIMVR
jgi:peptidylprolyl isomerase